MSHVPGDSQTSQVSQITQVRQTPALPAAGRLEAGAMLGDIQLSHVVGQGQSSLVYKGTNLLVGKSCAVKLFRPELALGPVKRGRLLHAARRADAIAVEGIISTFEGGLAPDAQTSYLVQEWFEGRSLRDILADRGALAQRAYLPVLRKLVQILGAAHSAGVVHGALHSGNILLAPGDGEPRVAIVDFGIREVHPGPDEQLPGLHRAPEHAFYLAPEQAKRLPGDHRSDIYALSAILYEMVTGRPPLVGETFAATVEKQLSESPQAPSQLIAISAELETTILRGLDKDPSRRIPSVEALLAAIDPGASTTGKHLALQQSPSTEVHALHLPAHKQDRPAHKESRDPGRSPAKDFGKTLSQPGGLSAQILDAPPHTKTRIYLIAAGILFLLASGAAAIFFLTSDSPEKKRARSPKRRRPTSSSARRDHPRQPAARATAHRPSPPRTASGTAQLASPPVKAATRRVKLAAKIPAPLPVNPAHLVAKSVARLSLGKTRMIERMSGAGTINIVTHDPGAKIFLDGHYVGTGKTRTLRRVPAGRHRLHIEVGDKKLPAKDITLRPKSTVDVQL